MCCGRAGKSLAFWPENLLEFMEKRTAESEKPFRQRCGNMVSDYGGIFKGKGGIMRQREGGDWMKEKEEFLYEAFQAKDTRHRLRKRLRG